MRTMATYIVSDVAPVVIGAGIPLASVTSRSWKTYFPALPLKP